MFWLTFLRAAIVASIAMFATFSHAQLESLLGPTPKLETISTSELKPLVFDWLEKQKSEPGAERLLGQQKYVLVDVRSDEEVRVSVIPGAITKAQYNQDSDKYKGKTVIAYCTVGGRSARYAAELAKAGVPVVNYKGSILEWVQSGLPLATLDGQSTNKVHLYSDRYKVPEGYEMSVK